MSKGSEINIDITGIPSAQHLLQSLPDRLVRPTVWETLHEALQIGIDLMSTHVSNSIRTEKSRGVLAESIQGDIDTSAVDPETGAGKYRLSIGSNLPYAPYASREIFWSRINKPVLIQPMQRWRFIGIRPPMPGHPFLEYTLFDMMHKVIPEKMRGKFTSASGTLQREVDALKGVTG